MRRLSLEDWSVLADRIQITGDPRGAVLAQGLQRGPHACDDLNPACALAPLIGGDRWPVTLLCPPLDTAARLALYGTLRPVVERLTRTRLAVAGGPADIARQLRRRPRRARRAAGRTRIEALTALARCVDPAIPPRWAWAACRQLVRGDMVSIEAIAAHIERWSRLAELSEG